MNSLRTAKRFWLPLFGLWVLLYGSFSLVKPPLLDGTDSIQAEAAREMALHGDWITPHVNGVRYLAASPLLTWTTALSFKLFGVADWAARLTLALFALALFVTTLALGARLFLTPVAGFYAALTLLTSAGIFLFAHLLYPQVLITLWLTLAIYYFWRSLHHEHASLRTAIGFAVACALGVLTQGLSGVIVPVVILVLFLAITRSLPHLLRWHPAIIALVFLLITVPWHIAEHRANAVDSHLLAAPGPHSAPIPVVWAFLLFWIMPWCFFAVASLFRLPARVAPHSKHMDPSHQVRLLLMVWLIVEAVMVAFTRRQEFSVLPALPALALLGAGWLAADEAAPSRDGRIFAWVFFALGVAGAAVALFLAVRTPFLSSGVDIATLLRLQAVQHHLFLGYLADLTFASMGAFHIPLYISAAALLAGVVMNLYFRLKNQTRMANCFLAGMMVFLLIAAHIALNTFSPVVSSAVLAEAIKPEVNPGDLIVVAGHYSDASALAFYLERNVYLVNTPVNDLGRFSSDNPAMFENPEALAAQWNGEGRVFLWTSAGKAPSLPAPVYLIGRSGGREILSNEPNNGGASF
jgi:4-amino-4-deoxy-L-arabinose transferase-like glycosyltransferase